MGLFFELIANSGEMVMVNVNAIASISQYKRKDGTVDGSIISTMDGGLPIHVIDDYGTIKENLRKYLPKV